MSGITNEMLSGYAESFRQDPANRVRRYAVMKNGLDGSGENTEEINNNPLTFSVELKDTGEITNQKQSGRCWLFAALNTMRYEVIRAMNVESFELSQAYPLFWDKLEKANYFMESILATAHEPREGRLVSHLLSEPMQDGGQWDMVAALTEKYGCVPKDKMPETFHSSDTRMMNRILTSKLREDAMILRDAVRAGKETEAMKQEMLREIYQTLVICLGEPPKRFTLEWRDKDDVFHRDSELTPLAFYKKYTGFVMEDYVSVINAPTQDKPFYRSFTVAYLGNVVDGRAVRYLNLPIKELKRLAIAQLEDGKPVWFGCDVGKSLIRKEGIMSLKGMDYESVTGMRFGLNKEERLDYGESMMTHAMVFQGVNLVDGKPNRWKVENSWGKDRGRDGYYVMTDEWFDEFNYQVVVHKKHLTREQLEAYESQPIVLNPWDPMGSLA